MEQVYKDRLLRLAYLLEEDAKNENGAQFDLSTWASGTTINCGTQACAVGIGMLDPEFQAQGLSYRLRPPHHSLKNQKVYEPIYNGKDNFDAVEEFFGICEDHCLGLFDTDFYSGPTRGAKAELIVAKRIRDFVEDPDSLNNLLDDRY